MSWPWLLAIASAFAAVNLVSLIGQGGTGRTAVVLDAVQLIADTTLVLMVLWLGKDDPNSADWAILVLPVIEGAIRFQTVGAVVSWAVLAVGYIGWNVLNHGALSIVDVAQRLTVVFLVALPSGLLAEHLVAEIAAHRRGRDEAERRNALLRAAALGGRKSTSLDVDEILDVLRNTVGEMGFADPEVFEIEVASSSRLDRPAGAVLAAGARHPARRPAPAAPRRRARRRRADRVAAAGEPGHEPRAAGARTNRRPTTRVLVVGAGRDRQDRRGRAHRPLAAARRAARVAEPRASSCSRPRPARRCATRRCTASCRR